VTEKPADIAASKDEHQRITQSLETIAGYFSQEETLRRERRIRWFFARTVGIFSVVVSGLIGSWELGKYAYKQWQISQMASRYAEVAAEIYYQENNPEVAGKLIDKALELEEDEAEYRYLRAYLDGMGAVRTLLNLDRPYTKTEMNEAHQAMANAVFLKELQPARPEPYILQSQLHAALKQYSRAQAEIRKAIKLDPKNDFAYVRLALIHANQGQTDPAMEAIEQALTLNEASKWAWLWKGVVLATHQQSWEAARQAYAKAIEQDARFDLAYYNRGWTWVRQQPRDYAKARADFEQALRIKPDYKEALYALGMVYGYQNQYAIADRYLSRAVEIDQQFLTGWKWRGIVREEMGQYKEALADFDQAIELDPSNAALYTRRGRIHQHMDNIAAALQDLRLAADIAPEQRRTWLYLGRLYLELGEYHNAMAQLNKALEIQPEYSDALLARAKTYMAMKQSEQALADAASAVEHAQYRVERFYVARGDLLAALGKMEQALHDYRQAREQSPRYAEAWLKEAQMAYQLGKIPMARQAIERYVELEPQDSTGKVLREQIKEISESRIRIKDKKR